MKISKLFSATKWRKKIAHGKTVGFNPKINKAPDGAKEKNHGSVFCRPIRGLFQFVVLPTVLPWAIFFRTSGAVATQFAVAAMVLFGAFGARAETTNDLSDAEIQGRALAQNILDNLFEAATGSKVAATLKIRDGQRYSEIPLIIFTVRVAENTWPITFYQIDWTNRIEQLSFHPTTNQPISFNYDTNITTFKLFHTARPPTNNVPTLYLSLTTNLTGNAAMIPFANSDFWICDLGLEFFHWPEQKILPNPTSLKRGRSYTLLESTNPNPSTNGYSRVLSWIDKETGGILEADAFDAKGKLLKVFEPNSFKKVNGQYQVSEMEMDNVQTGSRTRLEFDLNKK